MIDEPLGHHEIIWHFYLLFVGLFGFMLYILDVSYEGGTSVDQRCTEADIDAFYVH